MWAVYILLGLLALILLLLLLVLFVPVWARVTYRGELCVRVRVLGIPLTVLPASAKSPKADKPSGKETKKSAEEKAKSPSRGKELLNEISRSFREDGVQATLDYLQALAKLAGRAAGRALRSITVDCLRLDMLIATGDAADTAQRYGQVCGVLYPALAAVSGPVHIRRRRLRVEPNFLAEKSAVQLDVRLHIWVFRLVGAAIALLVGYGMMRNTDSVDKKEEPKHG